MASSIQDPSVRFIANEAIMVARAGIAPLTDFTKDFTADAQQPGSTMLVQFFDDGEASDFDATSNNYGTVDGKSSFIPITFGTHAKKTFGFTPADYLNIGQPKFQQAGEAAGRAVARKALKTVIKLIDPTHVKTSGKDEETTYDGKKVGTGLDFGDFNEVVAAYTQKFTHEYVAEELYAACDAADIDPADTVLLLNGKEYGQLIGSLDAHTYGDGAAIMQGRIPGLYGFRAVVKVDNLTVTAGNNLRAALAPANSIGIAGRTVPILNPQYYQDVGTVTDDKSGLVIGFRRGGDWKTDESDLTAEALFGARLLQPTKIVRIVSEATDPVGPTATA